MEMMQEEAGPVEEDYLSVGGRNGRDEAKMHGEVQGNAPGSGD